MPLVMQSVSCVTVDIGTVMYQLGKSVKRCSRRLSASSLGLNSNVGLIQRLRCDCRYSLTSYPCDSCNAISNNEP